MIRQASNGKNTILALTIALISLVAITSILASSLTQQNFIVNKDAISNQMPERSPLSVAVISNSLDNLNFNTYTYGCNPVQEPNLRQMLFSFPDKTTQSQLAGSDALSVDSYLIQKLDFEAIFTTPKISARGFDEMVIFAASDTTTYKGTEFGVRLDLKDGYIYGYCQEPKDKPGDVNFQMFKLIANDGENHHYTLIKQVSKVSFYIDGINYGYFNYPSKTDYTCYTFLFWQLSTGLQTTGNPLGTQ